jgi:hypothetical protein
MVASYEHVHLHLDVLGGERKLAQIDVIEVWIDPYHSMQGAVYGVANEGNRFLSIAVKDHLFLCISLPESVGPRLIPVLSASTE